MRLTSIATAQDATIVGPHEARCISPAVYGLYPARATPLEISLNGDPGSKTSDGSNFTFYGQPAADAEIAISAVFPRGGPISGGTTVAVHGVGMFDRGDVRVRFGEFGGVQADADADGYQVKM